MPALAARPCTYPGCGTLITTGSRCETHQWRDRKWPRLRGPALQRMRLRVFTEQHFHCAMCGRLTDNLELDHIIPVSHGGKDDRHNLQGLCPEPCHRQKTLSES